MSDAETSYGFKICLCVEALIGLVELYMISWRRVSRSLTIRLETKMPWGQTPSQNKKSVMFTTVTTNTYQDQINAGFSKVCEIFKVCGIESLKYIREFTHWSIIVGRFPRPESVTLNETNCDWLFLCGSVVEHCVSSAKGCGFDSQGTRILMKMYNLTAIVSRFG